MTPHLAATCIAIAVLTLSACGGQDEKTLIAAASESIEQKDTPRALIQLKAALQKNPDSGEARFQLGKLLLSIGDPMAATVELQKAEELRVPPEKVVPELARAQLLLGGEVKLIVQYGSTRLDDAVAMADLLTSLAKAHAMQSEPAKAYEALQAALLARPMYAPALIVQARLKAGEGDFDGGLALLDSVIAREPGNEDAGVLKGEILTSGKKDVTAALETFRKVLAVNAKSLAAHVAVIKLLSGQDKDAEARAKIQELKAIAPDYPETLFFEAEAAFADKDYKRSRVITDRMLKGMPENVRVLELAGAAELGMRQYPLAESLLGKAVKGAPRQLRARHLLAETYLRSNQPGKVLELLKPVLDSKSVDGASLSIAGEAWMQLGDAKKADAAFQAASKAAPDDLKVRTASALAQLMRGNASAITDLERIAAQDKGLRADLALISTRVSQKEFAGALKAIDALERKVPEQPLAHDLRGRVRLLQGDTAAATKAFEAALAKDANYYPSIASLAAIDLDRGKADDARRRLEALVQAQPRNTQGWLALAELSSRTGGSTRDVLKFMREAVKADPNESTPHLMLVNQLLALGESKDALVAAQSAAAALPGDPAIAQALGRSQLAAGDGSQAQGTFQRLAALQPSNPTVQMLLADTYVAAKDYASAARALRKALEIRPGLLQAQAALVRLALLDKRPQDGLNLAREMQKSDPKNGLGYALEGDAEAARSNWDGAVAAYRQALQRTADTDTAVKLHSALRGSGKTADADRMAAEWLRLQPKDVAFHFYMGDLMRVGKDAAAAETQYRKVLELQPNNALALNNLAWLLVQQGKPGAVAAAEKANQLLPDRAPLMDTLAAALAADNQLPQAIDLQARAVAREPDDLGLKLNLARYYVKAGDKARARFELEALAKTGSRFAEQAEVTRLLATL